MRAIETVQEESDVGRSNRRSAWLLVMASTVGLFLHFGSVLVNTFGVFLIALCDEFRWTRTQVSLAFTLATLTAMLTMPLTGWAADRFGSRRPILVCTTLFGALFASLSLLTPNLWHLYAVFLLLGMVGPGTSAIPHARLITRWFTERRGLALGVAMCGTAFGGVIWPSFTQSLLDRYGWRNAYAILGALVLIIAVPLLLTFLKELAGSSNNSARKDSHIEVDGLGRREALRSGVFWLLIAAFFIVSASIQACMIHLVPMMKDRGMTPGGAAFAASLLGAAGMIGRLGTGYLLDLLPATLVPALAFSVVSSGILLLFTGVVGISSYLASALIGLGYGAESATIPYLVGKYFGLRSFGEIYSYLFITVPLGGALGPVLMGVGFDRTGSYQTVLLLCGVTTMIAALLMFWLRAFPTYEAKR